MKTYRIPGTATEWSPTGNNQEVQIMETIVNAENNGISVPVTFSVKGETTRKGVRRVVLRAEANLPGAFLSGTPTAVVDPRSTQAVAAHLVLQCPQILAQQEAGSSNASGALGLIGKMISDIIAVATNESTTSAGDHRSVTGLVARALCGGSVLDPVSGSYGETSERLYTDHSE